MCDISKESILIIDDDKIDLQILSTILKTDYTVFTAKSPELGLKLALEIKPSIILLDIIMPNINGFELMQIFKERDELRDIPIILVSGLDSPEDEVKGFMLGAVDYIKKPFNSIIIQTRVKNQISRVIHTRELESISKQDPLTGLTNRRGFDEYIEKTWAHSVREGLEISLLYLDADKFKQYNDHFGHPKGDLVLQKLAKIFLSEAKRPTDCAARIGGEEFAVVLPNTSLDGAKIVAEQIRTRVEALNIHHPSAETSVLTVSIGIATIIPTVKDKLWSLMSRADENLYSAKNLGRNRVYSD